jgi:phage-related protein (TIGR01555 family)
MSESVRPRGRPRKVVEHTETDVVKSDGWNNVLVGLGGRKDKAIRTSYGTAVMLDDVTLFQMYLGEGLASRIVNIVADDSTREWIYFPQENYRKQLTRALEVLKAEEVCNNAIRWRRLYGGSLILLGAMDGGSVDTPLREDRIKTIEYLKVIDRTCVDLSASEFDKDPSSPTFGKILKYRVRYEINNEYYNLDIHHTRVIEMKNDPIPPTASSGSTQEQRYWGISSLQTIFEEVRDLGGITQSVANILYEFVMGKYKFKGLAQLMATGGEEKLIKRLQAIDMGRSIINAVVLDSEEDYSKDYATVAGLPEIIDRFMLKLSGSTGIPVTRLFGRSPAGLNATGENDLRNYYDLIEADQRNRLMPAIRRLVQVVARANGIKEDIEIEFNSLYQMTEEEKSQVAKLDAETAAIQQRMMLDLIDAGIRDGAEYAKELGYGDEYEEPEEPAPPPPVVVETETKVEE